MIKSRPNKAQQEFEDLQAVDRKTVTEEGNVEIYDLTNIGMFQSQCFPTVGY